MLAVDRTTQKNVAIKILKQDLPSVFNKQQALECFHSEI